LNKQFGATLSEGISSIAQRWRKTKSAVRREMTQELREAGFELADSTIEGWCRGFIPKEPELIAWIVRYCLQRGRIDEHWVESLLHRARYPEKADLLDELFPSSKEQQSIHISTSTQRLQYVEDPEITLQTSLGNRLVGRTELLIRLQQSLIKQEHQGRLALTGLPGVGKTALALELAQSHETREMYRDGILYVNLGPRPDIKYHLKRWAKLLGVMEDSTTFVDIESYIKAIHASIGKRKMFLVIDDAWSVDAALAFQVGSSCCVHLLTTRFTDIALHFAGEAVVRIPELREDESRQLLANFVPHVVKDEPEKINELIHTIDGLPLALILIGKHLQIHAFHRQPRRLQQALLNLQKTPELMRLECPQKPLEVCCQHSSSLMTTIDTSYQALSKGAQRALRALCILPVKPNSFSEEAALIISDSTPAILDELNDSGLLESAGIGRYTIHRTIALFALLKHRGWAAEMRLVEFFIDYAQRRAKDFATLDQESCNILHALSLADKGRMLRWLIRGVQALFPFLLQRGWYETATYYCQQEFEAARLTNDQEAICTAHIHITTLSIKSGEYTQAESYAQKGLVLARHLDHSPSICILLHFLGVIAYKKGNYTEAEMHARAGLTLARQLNDSKLIRLHFLLLNTVGTKNGGCIEAKAFLRKEAAISSQINESGVPDDILIAPGLLVRMLADYIQAANNLQIDEGKQVTKDDGTKPYLTSSI
jgi:tetratricopeptide (TPR) repeat protein